MTWSFIDTWIVLTGMVTAMACALVGNFLVVRRMSLMGDAISHAVLPGIAAAFLLGGSRHPAPMFAGAVAAGLCAAFLTEWLQRRGRVEHSSAMGVVFTTLFALGLVMIVRAADTVDLDPGCVLYGSIELSPLDTVLIAGVELPRAFVTGLIVLIVNAVLIALFYKEFKVSSFDPELADTLGIPARRMYYLLMAMVAVTTVASFESVGSILVIATLIVPAASAQFLSVRLGGVIAWSLVLAAASAIGGHVAAITVPTWFGFLDTSTSGSMAVISGLLFAGTFLFAPQRGVWARFRMRAGVRRRILVEDALGALHRWREDHPSGDGEPTVTTLARLAGHGASEMETIIAWMRRQKLVEVRTAGDIHLTDAGQREAATVVREHRLWEDYLHHRADLAADHVHDVSARLEHIRDPEVRDRLAREAGQTGRDPHGKTIP